MGKKKSKKRKKKTKHLRPIPRPQVRPMQTIVAPEPGCFWAEKWGINLVVLAKIKDDENVEAALFCVDRWRDGLFNCLGRLYGSLSELETEVKNSSLDFRPTNKEHCQRIIKHGLWICEENRLKVPKTFKKWRHLAEPLDEIVLNHALYLCPGCGRNLEYEIIEFIKKYVNTPMQCYIVCERCKSSTSRKRQKPEVFIAKRDDLFDGFQELTTFALDMKTEPRIMKIELEERDAQVIATFFKKGDALMGLSYIIERSILNVAQPTEIVTDAMIKTALDEIMNDIVSQEYGEYEGKDEISIIKESIASGLDMFADVHFSEQGEDPSEELILKGLEKIRKSVKTHRSLLNKRRYIEFVEKYLP